MVDRKIVLFASAERIYAGPEFDFPGALCSGIDDEAIHSWNELPFAATAELFCWLDKLSTKIIRRCRIAAD